MFEKVCNVCKKEALKVCSRCKAVFYCCVEHQKDDWKQHKPNCVEPKKEEEKKHNSEIKNNSENKHNSENGVFKNPLKENNFFDEKFNDEFGFDKSKIDKNKFE